MHGVCQYGDVEGERRAGTRCCDTEQYVGVLDLPGLELLLESFQNPLAC